MSKKRLNKALAEAGIASRRGSEELIFDGRVEVNGEVSRLPQHLVDPSEDRIVVDGKQVTAENKLYFLLNKPSGFLCSSRRTSETPLVIDLFQGMEQRLFTVGRLDKDTTGLILVTNDGGFANKVIHPRANLQKEYLARVDHFITADHLRKISRGTRVEGVFVRPLRVTKVRRNTLKIVVMEGKKHEVRLLLKNAGLRTRELCRIRLGNLSLGNLPLGSYKKLTPQQTESLFNSKS